jgi:iron complex transport system substrate-binding protein
VNRPLLQVLVVLLVCAAVPAGAATASIGSTVAETTATAEIGEDHASVSAQATCEYPVSVTDATGATVEIEEEPEDVVVTGPNLAQHVWEIGAREKVTGMPVNFFTSYLNGSQDRTHVVNDQGQVVQETVVDLDPDLVLAANITSKQSIQSLRDAGVTVYHYETATDLEAVTEQVALTGQLVGECSGATDVTEQMSETITQIEDAVADADRPTVYYDLGFPFTAGSNTVESDVIETAGGDNLAADVDSARPYFQISEEVVAAEDPDWLIIAAGAELPDVAGIQESTAVENDQIIEVNPNFFNQHGPRTVRSLETIAEALHPEALAAAQATPTPTPTTEPTPQETPTPAETPTDDGSMDGNGDDSTPTATATAEPTDTPSDGDDGAGFAIVAALAAIGSFAVLARRSRNS